MKLLPLTDNYEELNDAIARYVPVPIADDLLKRYGASVVVAGGFVRSIMTGGKPRDIDIWTTTPDRQTRIDTVKTFQQIGLGAFYESTNAINLDLTMMIVGESEARETKTQLLTRFPYNDVSEVFASFDLTICQAAIFYNRIGGYFDGVCSEWFWPDLTKRVLRYTHPEDKISSKERSLARCIKYRMRKYVAENEDDMQELISRAAPGLLVDTGLQVSHWLSHRDKALSDLSQQANDFISKMMKVGGSG